LITRLQLPPVVVVVAMETTGVGFLGARLSLLSRSK